MDASPTRPTSAATPRAGVARRAHLGSSGRPAIVDLSAIVAPLTALDKTSRRRKAGLPSARLLLHARVARAYASRQPPHPTRLTGRRSKGCGLQSIIDCFTLTRIERE
jgi:hypothetical protein